ncbi:hypothetical protein SAMN04487783_1811 [Agrococcus baldri]|uniref:Uncharacterized protein n=1 Tax=Agrococcus baldri TaxID=153730 RepID=A0AA94HN73_9MICO|nr:hypothetical protein [Agrococcus baldri]SFS14292.1 hypothetical protein SAMN04487783_1811 [Agrococcus baldri]
MSMQAGSQRAVSMPVGGSHPATIEAKLERRRRALAAAVVVSAATTLVTGLAHSLGGGAAPDHLLVATAFVATLLVLAPVVGARGSLPRQVVAVAVAQLVQHVLYSLPGAASPAAEQAHVAVHAHGAAAAMPSATVLHEHASMPLAHVAAGALTLVVLRLAPLAIAAMLAAMSPRLAATVLDGTAPPARRRASVTAAHAARRCTLDVLRSALVTRGPPLPVV